MDDEKSMTERLTDALSKATDSVKSTFSSMVDTASNAAQHSMQSNAERISGQTVTELDPGQAAAGTGGQAYIPAATDAVAVPVPLFATPVVRKPRKTRTKSRSAKTSAAAKKVAAKKSNKKSVKQPVTKSVPKKSAKKSGKKAKKSVVKKAAKKSTKASKKSKR
jgi:hypothetical protein